MVQLLTLRVGDCWLLLTALPSHDECPTIKVGRRGQIKHILLWKQSSLNQKTNFRTLLMSFCFLFRFLPFFSKNIWVPQFPEVPWSVHPKFSNTLTRLNNSLKLLLFPLRIYSIYVHSEQREDFATSIMAAQVPEKEKWGYSKFLKVSGL